MTQGSVTQGQYFYRCTYHRPTFHYLWLENTLADAPMQARQSRNNLLGLNRQKSGRGGFSSSEKSSSPNQIRRVDFTQSQGWIHCSTFPMLETVRKQNSTGPGHGWCLGQNASSPPSEGARIAGPVAAGPASGLSFGKSIFPKAT